MQENEFLQDYEIGKWQFSPRIYKILAFSVTINLLTIFVLGKTNLLQSRACDSAYVGKICQAFDMIYVGSKIFSGDTGYVVKDYNKTRIDDADVVWVSQDGAEPQFQYPGGYFYNENTESEALGDDFAIVETPSPIDNFPISPPSNNNDLLNRRPNLPKKNKRPVSGDLPDSILGGNKDDEKGPAKDPTDKTDPATAKNGKTGDKDKEPAKNPLETTTAKNSDPVAEIEINKKPLQDFAEEILVKWETNEVDLSQQFRVRLTGEITKNGRLDPKRTSYTETAGNAEMIIVAKRAIESVGDSGWLDYLSRFDVKKLNIVFAQNETQLLAVVDSKLPSPEKANSVATGLNGIIQATLLAHNNGWKKMKDDEIILLKAAKITSQGNLLRINFDLEKPVAQKMINFRLKEFQAKKQEEKDKTAPQKRPNGGAKSTDGNTNTAK